MVRVSACTFVPMLKKLSALWIVGWFPSKSNPFAGNFIERHAVACSSEIDITLVHAAVYEWGSPKSEPKKFEYPFQLIWIPIPQFKKAFLKPLNLVLYYAVFYFKLIKQLQTLGKMDILHVHVPDKCGLVATWIKKKMNISKMVLTEHWAIYNSPVSDHFGVRNPWFQYVIKQTWKNTDYAAQVSLPLHVEMEKILGKNIPVMEFPNVVPADFFNAIESETDQNFRWIHVSNFEERKNIPIILQAFQRLQNEQPLNTLTLVGATPEKKEKFERQFHSISNVQFLTQVDAKKLNEMFRNSDAMVMASSSENAPCVISEALCTGLPVLSSNIGGIANMIHETNGLLFDLDIDKNSFSANNNHNIETLYSSMIALQNIISQNQFQKVAENAQLKYGAATISIQLKQLYNSLI